MRDIFNLIAVISGILMVVFILTQSRGSGLGEAFGGDSTFYHTKRGPELVIFQLTIFFGVVFVVSIILGLLSN